MMVDVAVSQMMNHQNHATCDYVLLQSPVESNCGPWILSFCLSILPDVHHHLLFMTSDCRSRRNFCASHTFPSESFHRGLFFSRFPHDVSFTSLLSCSISSTAAFSPLSPPQSGSLSLSLSWSLFSLGSEPEKK